MNICENDAVTLRNTYLITKEVEQIAQKRVRRKMGRNDQTTNNIYCKHKIQFMKYDINKRITLKNNINSCTNGENFLSKYERFLEMLTKNNT